MAGNPGADYPWDPAEQERLRAQGKEIPPPPEPPQIPAPAPGGGMPAARLTDLTMHFGVIGPVVTGMTVLIGGLPAACVGDPHVCPMFDGPKPHVGGVILMGSTKVFICNKPAARVGDLTQCVGPSGAIAPPGCPQVLIS